MALTLIDAENFTLCTGNSSVGATGYPSNGPSGSSIKPYVGTYYNGQYLRDTSTMETGNACMSFRAHNNASAQNNMQPSFRFKPRAADGTNRVLDGLHGLWRVRVEEVPDFATGVAGSAGVGYYSAPGPVIMMREPTIANKICGVWMQDQGESTALYVWHNGLSGDTAVAPALWLGDLPYGQWLWVEGVIDLDHTSSTEARQAWRIVYPDGNPGRWVYDTWTRTHTTGTDACFWSIGFDKDGTNAIYTRAWEYLSLDRYIISDAVDWWTKYDADGFGNDDLSPDLKIGFVVCDNSITTSGTVSNGGTGALNEIPSDSSVANYKAPSSSGAWFRVGFSTSGTSYDTADLTDVAVCLGVVVKATMSWSGNNGVFNGELGIRSSGGTITSHTMDVFSQNWAEANAYGYPSTVQPGGSTRWDASSTPMSDLAGMTVYVAKGTEAGDLRTFDVGAYVVYRPTQTAPGATVGELTGTPTVTDAVADCPYVPVEWRAVVESQPQTISSTDYTSVPIFADRSISDLYVYTCNWGVFPYETTVSPDGTAGGGTSTPMVVRHDLGAGTSEIVWRATATVPKTGSYTSSPPTGGPPTDNGSGSWCWERWNGGTMAAYNMRPHRTSVDNWPTYSDGTTPNPFYGWIYVAFGLGNYDPSDGGSQAADYNRPCQGIMLLDPSRTYDAGDGILCMAKMIVFPSNSGASASGLGAFGVTSNPDEILITRPQGAAIGQDVMHVLSKSAMEADIDGTGFPSTADTTGWWTSHTFTLWTADYSDIINQASYGAGKLWASGSGYYQLVKTSTNSFDSKRRARFGRGNNAIKYVQVRIWNASPDGLMYGVAELDSGGATSVGDSRVTLGGDLQRLRSPMALLQMTPGSSSADPTITKHWRVPLDQFTEAPTSDGEWRLSKLALTALPVTNEDIFIVIHEAYDSISDDFFPRHALAWFNTRRNEWREVRRPFLNSHPVYAGWYLPPDAPMDPPGAPSNRADMFDGDLTATDDLYRFLMVDEGWPDGDYDYYDSGNVASTNLGAVYAGDFGPGPWRRESDIAVDFTIDLPTGVTTVQGWRVEVDGNGLLGSGLLVDGSDTDVVTTAGGTVTVNASIPAHQVPDHASDTLTVDVYWQVGGVWSARAT